MRWTHTFYRAKATYYLRQYDTTAAILASALGRIEARDTSRLRVRYISRAGFYYSIGLAYQQGHRDTAAQTAFQHSVTENLGSYMAHVQLANEALTLRDTVTAIAEARQAADIRPDDPVVQLFLGKTLLNARRGNEAVTALRAAIAADPYCAQPYYYLGQASELANDTPGALAGYRGYVVRAKRRDGLRESARKAIARLGGT